MYSPGQVLLGKIRFKDGEYPEYPRPYLIISAAGDELEVLNVSSIGGKARKLSFASNIEIVNYNPPLRKPSFVKLDSLTTISADDARDMRLLDGGRTLANTEIERILSALGR